MSTVLRIDGLDCEPPAFALDEIAWKAAELSADEVERRILDGEDRIEVFGPNGGAAVYEVPGWTEHPIRRLRITIARRRRGAG
jgi:hypothetical protein